MEFLRSYINNPSPVGFESSGQKLWLDYVKPFADTHFVDPYGTAVCSSQSNIGFKVVIKPMRDEISWFVNYITDQGLIYLKRNGGVDHQVAPAKRVFIHGKKGPVKAVFGWPAIHTRTADQKTLHQKLKTCFSIAAPGTKEVEALGIHIGAVVTYQEGFDELANDYMIGRAFDNRIGGL